MRSHHLVLTTILATVGLTAFTVVGLSRASETYSVASSAYWDASDINSVLVLSAGTELASGRSVSGLSVAFDAADTRAAEAVSRLEASSPWWDAIGHPERKRLVELAREERDIVKKIGETVRHIGLLPLEEWSPDLGELRKATVEFEGVHREVMDLAR